jgi:hypothetical protein
MDSQAKKKKCHIKKNYIPSEQKLASLLTCNKYSVDGGKMEVNINAY